MNDVGTQYRKLPVAYTRSRDIHRETSGREYRIDRSVHKRGHFRPAAIDWGAGQLPECLRE